MLPRDSGALCSSVVQKSMPELPEVETIKRDLELKLLGQRITQVTVYDSLVIRGLKEREFIKNLINKKIVCISRRAKAIVCAFDEGSFLVVQLRMTGQLMYKEEYERIKETRVIFKLANGHFLNFNDQRRFGRLIYAKDLKEIAYLENAGPEPLNGTFSAQWLQEALQKRKTSIKTLLLNQQFLAGIGNIYASEILFTARIHPAKEARALSSKEVLALCKAVRNVLSEAIKYRGTSMRNYRDLFGREGQFNQRLNVYGREGGPCKVCRKPIERLVQTGRSTFFCPGCQGHGLGL